MALDPLAYEKVNLFLEATDLPKVEFFSNDDCFACLYVRDRSDPDHLHLVHTTSVIINSQSPVWVDPFEFDYYFEYPQMIVIKVYHSAPGKSTDDPSEHKCLGHVEFKLAALIRAEGQRLSMDLEGSGGSDATVCVKAESCADTRDNFCFKISGHKLKNVDGMGIGFFGKSDPIIQISRKNEDGTRTQVYRSVRIENCLDPEWDEAKVPMNQLCTGDLRRPLILEVMDLDTNGSTKPMGEVETSVHEMVNDPMDTYPVMLNGDKKGHLTVECSIENNPTFTQFIAGGAELSVIVAIDFTGSNGDPINPDSLHHIDPTGGSDKWNPYQMAITSVCNIVEYYDSDKNYPVYGFGARVKIPDNPQPTAVQHCFPVYGEAAEVQGVPGILQAYQDGVQNVLMSGPTLFQEVIEKSTEIAEAANCSQEQQKYTILLIMTDGVIDDMTPTKKALIRACDSPLSCLVIGVGPEDFSDMRELDADGELLQAHGRTATRDLVQFIDMQPGSTYEGWMNLSQKVLAEIPTQFLEYMKLKGIVPNPPK